jgi:hypothetical protein
MPLPPCLRSRGIGTRIISTSIFTGLVAKKKLIRHYSYGVPFESSKASSLGVDNDVGLLYGCRVFRDEPKRLHGVRSFVVADAFHAVRGMYLHAERLLAKAGVFA